MKMPELLFYAESEGFLPTRTGKINAVINEIKAYPSPEIDMVIFERILNKYGLSYSALTENERNFINYKIQK